MIMEDSLTEPLLSPLEQHAMGRAAEANAAAVHEQDNDGTDNDNDEANDENDTTNTIVDNVDTIILDPWKNPTVRLSLLLCLVSGTADSIWGNVILSGFLLALAQAMNQSKRANTLVGTAEAAQGLTQLLSALPVGYVADVYGKATMVRWGGGLMLITIFITLWVLLEVVHKAQDSPASANTSYMILVIALALWGIIYGISFGPSQALYSDSIPKGRRSEMLTWLYTCYLLSSAVGPIVSITLLQTVSSEQEDWSIHEIFPVFFVGVCMEIPAAIIMFFFSEKYTVPEDATSDNQDDDDDDDDEPDKCENVEPEEECHEEQAMIENAHATATGGLVSQTTTDSSLTEALPAKWNLGKALIPYVLFFSSLIVSLGSGASVKYFPLFFKELGFGSAAVQGIFLAVPIFISAFSFVAKDIGNKIGRIETTVLLYIIGTGLLYIMTWLSRDVGRNNIDEMLTESLCQAHPYRTTLIVVIYLLRTGTINCSYPLLESILMDSVPSNHRARWKSLESIASFGWTGSALLGGILSDKHSYQFTFNITATMQLCGGLLLLFIQPFVEAE